MAMGLERWADLIAGRRRFQVFITLTLGLLMGLRWALLPGLGGDDGEQLVFAQSFQWGYQLRNPPLYTWLVMALQGLVGVGTHTVLLLKFGLLVTIALLLRALAVQLGTDDRLASLAGASPLAIYGLGWDSMLGFSHSVLVTVFVLVAWIQLLRLRDDPGLRLYALFGLGIGLGLLAKPVFGLFAVALLAAALWDRDYRAQLRPVGLLIALGVAAAVYAPHGLWLAERLAQAVPAETEGRSLLDGLEQVARLWGLAIAFPMPFLVLFAAVFWPALRRGGDDWRWRLFLRALAVLLVIASVGVAAIDADRVRSHYMFVLACVPAFLFRRLGADVPAARAGVFAALLFAAAATLAGGIAGKYLLEPERCGRCQHHIPYDALAGDLEAAGFRGGTLIAGWHPDPLAGNFRARLPGARVISSKHPDVIAPLRDPMPDGRPACLLIWSGGGDPAHLIALANARFGAGIEPDAKPMRLVRPLAGAPGRAFRLDVLLAPARGTCR
jgi:hypothetical protein